MTIAFVDAPTSLSSAMILGALIDAGVSVSELRIALGTLSLTGYLLDVEHVQQGRIGATRVTVTTEAPASSPSFTLRQIRTLIEGCSLPAPAITAALAVFTRLAESEADLQKSEQIDELPLPEAGSVGHVVEVLSICLGLHSLGVRALYSSTIPVAHGPSGSDPLILEMLARAHAPTVPRRDHVAGATICGVAILTSLAHFEQPALSLARVGYSVGEGEPSTAPLLSLWLGEAETLLSPSTPLLILEATIDDMQGEFFGHALERLLMAGALDAWCTPITMKKSRPGVVLSVLCRPEHRLALVDFMLRETTTFGVRVRTVDRYAADRFLHPVETPYGPIAVKFKLLGGLVVAGTPEYEECKTVAAAQGVPLLRVYSAAASASLPFVGLEATQLLPQETPS